MATLASAPDDLHETMLRDVNAAIDRLAFVPRARQGRVAPVPRVDRVLACIGPGEEADAVVSWAEALAQHYDARVALLSVHAPPPYVEDFGWVSGWWGPLAQEHERLQHDVALRARAEADRLQARGLDAQAHVRRGSAVREIVAEARATRADVVVVGGHAARPVTRLLLGSVARSVADRVASHVLVARTPASPGPLLLATDGSDLSRRATAMGLDLAGRRGAQARVLHVLARESDLARVPREGFLAEVLARLDLPKLPPSIEYRLDLGHPGERIVAEARAMHASLVVLGSRGLGGVRNLALGGVSQHVASLAPCSVLLVKEARA